MAGVHDDGEIGFEEGMLLLPSHVLDEVYLGRNHHQKHQQIHHNHHNKSPGEPQSKDSKFTSRSSYQRPKLANGGHGMRAIFLGSGLGSCGTGVFLPQRAGTNFQPSKRPACAPVLLPSRVVQALNIDVNALGVQISPKIKVQKNNPRCREMCNNNNSTVRKNDQKDESKKQCSFISQNQNTSPETLLPKEWTY